ncbi:MAG: ABC transporter permease [Thermoprotei archaeon]|nr:ABC transporter permease [Thermoprotei archaeon]
MSRFILVIARKEFSDMIRSKRLWIILFILILIHIGTYSMVRYASVSNLKGTRKLLLIRGISNLTSSIAILGPILGIALGYDAISGERERGTLKLVLARPVYRDSVINGKALAGLCIIVIAMGITGLLTMVFGVLIYGMSLTLNNVIRFGLYTLLSILITLSFYAMSVLLSTLSKKSSTSLAISIMIWAIFAFILPLASYMIAEAMLGPPPMVHEPGKEGISRQFIEYSRRLAELNNKIRQFSLITHYQVVANALMRSEIIVKVDSRMIRRTVTLNEILSHGWWHIAILVIFTLVCFILSYVIFVRSEER